MLEDMVVLSLVLGPADEPIHTYSHRMTRWEAQIQMRDFGWNPETGAPDLWDDKPVMRALIIG
jgi:hypothetical protein